MLCHGVTLLTQDGAAWWDSEPTGEGGRRLHLKGPELDQLVLELTCGWARPPHCRPACARRASLLSGSESVITPRPAAGHWAAGLVPPQDRDCPQGQAKEQLLP